MPPKINPEQWSPPVPSATAIEPGAKGERKHMHNAWREEEECVDAEAGTPGEVHQDSSAVGPHPDDFDNDNDDILEAFDAVFNGVAWRPEEDLVPIGFHLQPNAASRVATELGRLFGVVLLLSSLSFGLVALYFAAVLRVPSTGAELPPGYTSWYSCPVGASRPAVTALGSLLPYNKARALVSVPKVLAYGSAMVSIGCLLSRKWTMGVWINALTVGTISVVATAIYIFADGLGIRALPNAFDPLVSSPMLVVAGFFVAVTAVRSRRSSTGLASRCPKWLFLLGSVMAGAFSTLLANALASMVQVGTGSAIVVGVTILAARGIGFIYRVILRSLSVPLVVCFAVLFLYDVCVVMAVRRYWMALPSLGDVASSAVVSAVLELSFNFASVAYAVRKYNAFVCVRRKEMASAQIHIFFTAVVSELISEHLALHGCLGYDLFLDRRILTIRVQRDKSQAVKAWMISFIMEVAVDAATVIPMVVFLPVSFQAVFVKHSRSPFVVLYFASACMLPHLIGLHSYLEKGHYMCD